MVNIPQLISLNVSTANWRSQSGDLSAAHSDFESVHILLRRFLCDRHSETPPISPPLCLS
ncbi:hypothetical protein [Nostoc sp. T09]|uniref:hypothetical protein n=1 Tax=Nostoc sp. T09 TaxID=1932621 RepID=UPI001180F556|nr:hypothetical protein [Nostoc sp. T09]